MTLPINLFIFFWLLATGSRVRGTWCPGKWWRAPLLPTWGNRNGTESQTGRTLTLSYIQKKHLQKSEVTENLIAFEAYSIAGELRVHHDLWCHKENIPWAHSCGVWERKRWRNSANWFVEKNGQLITCTDSVSRKTPRIFSRYRNKRLTHTTSGNKAPRRILNFEKLVCGFVEVLKQVKTSCKHKINLNLKILDIVYKGIEVGGLLTIQLLSLDLLKRFSYR